MGGDGVVLSVESSNEGKQRIVQLREFLAMDPANIPLACELFDAHMEAGETAHAVALVQGLPTEARGDAAIRFRHARAALIEGRYAEAVDLIRGLIDAGHDNVALWHDMAFAQLCLRDTGAARATLDGAKTRFNDNADLAIVAARVALMEGDAELALRYLDHALAMDPGHATVQGVRSLALLDGGQPDAAHVAASACLVKFPNQHEALLVAGTLALWRQDTPEAEMLYSRALDRLPNSGRCLSGLGQVRMLQNRLDDAGELLGRATAAMPDHIGTWHALAWVDLLRGHVDAAEASFQRGYDLDRNFADSHGGLALIHVLRGRNNEAELAIKRALRLNPQCPTALYAQSLLLEATGQGDEAARLLGSLVQPVGLPDGTDLAEFSRKLRARFANASSP